MTVKMLINKLLECPMDSELRISISDEEADYLYSELNFVVDYEDGFVGVVGEELKTEEESFKKD